MPHNNLNFVSKSIYFEYDLHNKMVYMTIKNKLVYSGSIFNNIILNENVIEYKELVNDILNFTRFRYEIITILRKFNLCDDLIEIIGNYTC